MIGNKKLVFFDTETSGLKKEDRICEVAYSYEEKSKSNYGSSFFLNKRRISATKLVNPQISITPEAAMTTGITDEMVYDKEVFKETKYYKNLIKLSKEKDTYFVAYNAPFDIDMFEKDDLFINHEKVIDLYRIAKHLYKKEFIEDRNGDKVPLSNNKLQYFRYLLKFDIQPEFKELLKSYGLERIDAHSALSDVLVLEFFFYYLYRKISQTKKVKDPFKKMVELSNTPVLEEFITFGNVFEKGKPYFECFRETYEQYGKLKNGYEYLDWCSSNMTFSIDTEYSVKIHFFNNLIDGVIPYNDKYLKYVNYGLVFEKNKEKAEKGLNLIHKKKEYLEVLKRKFKEKLEKEFEENMDKELGDKFPSLFLLRYLEK